MVHYKGHSFIKVTGNAGAPARMWVVRLYTKQEYDQLSSDERVNVAHLSLTDTKLIQLHFDSKAVLEVV